MRLLLIGPLQLAELQLEQRWLQLLLELDLLLQLQSESDELILPRFVVVLLLLWESLQLLWWEKQLK